MTVSSNQIVNEVIRTRRCWNGKMLMVFAVQRVHAVRVEGWPISDAIAFPSCQVLDTQSF